MDDKNERITRRCLSLSSHHPVAFFKHQLKFKIRVKMEKISSYAEKWMTIARLAYRNGAVVEWLLKLCGWSTCSLGERRHSSLQWRGHFVFLLLSLFFFTCSHYIFRLVTFSLYNFSSCHVVIFFNYFVNKNYLYFLSPSPHACKYGALCWLIDFV